MYLYRKMIETPVLLLIFNRPDTALKVFNVIREAKPKKLFIAADGPRSDKPMDKELCIKTRSIIHNVDWDCEVRTLFREENMGCGIAIYEAINWFFSYEEQGIILEDDCLPHPTFFYFCEEMLNYYRDDLEVFNISGSNNQFGRHRGDGSYYFSKYGHTWGWATWQRAWKNFDREIPDYPNVIESIEIESYWKNIFQSVYINKNIDIWDYQWLFYIRKNKAKAVVPNKNLILNIGFDSTATHTNTLPTWFKKYKLDKKGITNIVHPTSKLINKKADNFTFYIKFKKKKTFKSIIKKVLLQIFNDTQIQQIKSLIFYKQK